MSDVILQKYEVRKSNKEKTRFIEYMKKRMLDAGYEEDYIKVEEKSIGILKSRNIVVGDPEKAKVLLTAHYDTCAVLPFPNFMAPTSVPLFTMSQIIITILMLGMAFVVGLIAAILTGKSSLGATVFVIALYALLFYMLFGYRNKHTANDNTSGVIAITKILEQLSAEEREKVCVVYFDNEEKGLLGSEFFMRRHKKTIKDKLVINFDCIGDGHNVVVLVKKKMQDDELTKMFLKTMKETSGDHDVNFIHDKLRLLMFGSDQMHFEKGIGVCALRNSPLGMYVARIHTPFDTVCREENIAFIVDGANRFIKNI